MAALSKAGQLAKAKGKGMKAGAGKGWAPGAGPPGGKKGEVMALMAKSKGKDYAQYTQMRDQMYAPPPQ